MNYGMTIEYLKCRAGLNFEIDFRVNDTIGTIVTKCNLILFGKQIVVIHNILFFLNQTNMPLNSSSSVTFLWGLLCETAELLIKYIVKK